jgi:RNA polymerase sigma-70 factor (TIGR02943 family)
MGADGQPDPEAWVAEYGDLLYRYALVRVRRPDVAADLVQDALVEAWKNRGSFAGRSAPATWLVGILRHKVLDHLRRSAAGARTGQVPLDVVDDRPFTRRGFWKAGPGDWAVGPASDLERVEFWAALRGCLGELPDPVAAAFVLREMDGLETGEICQTLGITPTNLWTRLHRARLHLRACLGRRWFGVRSGREESPCRSAD